MRLITGVKNPTEELTVHILSSLWSWDISLTLNMTYGTQRGIFRLRSI